MPRFYAVVSCLAVFAAGALHASPQTNARPLSSYRHANWSVAEGLPHNRVQAIAQALDGHLWLGTPAGLAQFDGFSFTIFDRQHVPALRSNDVRALLADQDGSLWIGTDAVGVTRLRDGKFIAYGPAEGIGAGPVSSMVQDGSGAVWVAAGSGVFRFDGRRFIAAGEPADRPIVALVVDSSGLLAGVGNGTVTRVTVQGLTSHESGGVPLVDLRTLAIDRSGTLLAGGRGGVAQLTQGRWTPRDAPLANDAVVGLVQDAGGAVWIATEADGVFRNSTAALEHFGAGQGLSGDGVRAICEDWEGNIWIGTENGLDRLTVTRGVTAGRLHPPVHIDKFVVDGRLVPLPDDETELRLSPGIANLEIHYTALNLTSPESVHFRYRLEGYDHNWIDASNRRIAYYTNLGTGRYRFVVAATTAPGVWGPSAAALALNLPPNFFQTYSFLAAGGTGVVLLTVGVYWVRARRMRTVAEQLQRLVDERTAMLEQINQQLQRLTTIDGLTGIANRRRFDDVLQSEWRRARRGNAPMACIMIDIDNFKAFNDRYGHLRGDDCTKQIAAALRAGANRAGDLLARYGGEEFAVILPETTLEGALAVAQMLRARVEGLGIPHDASDTAAVVTISAGVASAIPRRDEPAETLVAEADRALYRAKHAGKNRVETATPTRTAR
jgi:diguanylate cyclase (GGDEF)-like protein